MKPVPVEAFFQSRCRECWRHGPKVRADEPIPPPGCDCDPPNYKEIATWGPAVSPFDSIIDSRRRGNTKGA